MKQLIKSFSPKKLAPKLFKILQNDVTSTTGSNLRHIMLLVSKSKIEDLNPADADLIEYCEIENENKWKIGTAKELLEVQSGTLQLEQFSYKDVKEMLNLICTS